MFLAVNKVINNTLVGSACLIVCDGVCCIFHYSSVEVGAKSCRRFAYTSFMFQSSDRLKVY